MERILIGSDSEVLIDRGLPVPLLPERANRQASAVFHQPATEDLAVKIANATGIRSPKRCLPDRDGAKSLDAIAAAYGWLADENLARHDTIIGVGGGAVTDASGYLAATWMRGIESVLVPTTLLGAVDAAIGGKTAINVGASVPGVGKNLVGAFWNPTRVVVDLDVLEANPPALILEGTAEILKAGLLGDGAIVDAYTVHGIDAPLDFLVPRAIAVKAAVVGLDPRESGRRAILNFGHTVGHGIEAVTGMPHGYAVAIGMVAEAALSARRYGFDFEWFSALVFSLGLPVAEAGVSAAAVSTWMERDKKRSAEGTVMALLRAVGDPVVETVSTEEIAYALGVVGAV